MGQCLSDNNGLKQEQNNGGTALPKYEWVGELGAGRKGEIKLMRNQKTKELVAVKYIARQVCVTHTAFAEHLIGISTCHSSA